MSATILKLRGEPDQRIDLSALTPQWLAGLSESEVAALPVGTGRKALTLGEAFRITVGAADDIRIAGGSARLDGIAAGLTRGRVIVEGDAGAFAARGMTGGELRISGNAGPFAGSAMSGGLLHIGGNAGDWLGGAETGEMTGMSGGAIIVAGRCGAHAGDRMRRGLIAVGGDAGDFPASRMIAGTLAVAGNCGRMPGYLMRRGTVLLGGEPVAWTPTFSESGLIELTVLRLITRQLRGALPGTGFAAFDGPVQRFAGDMATIGKGEIIQPAS
jgi:formylmethanofuran dehydrogenase subunit C